MSQNFEESLVAVTENIKVEDLILAYENYSFPWPIEGESLIPWFSPLDRGVLVFDDIHIPSSLKKLMKKTKFRLSCCQDFSFVIDQCEKVKRKGQDGTWINSKIKGAYVELFNRKKAYSVEVWSPKGHLVGGLYGVISSRYISGESMFFLESGASKVALVWLTQRLSGMGVSFIDTQMVTPLIESFGGKEVSRKGFIEMAEQSIILDDGFFDRLRSE